MTSEERATYIKWFDETYCAPLLKTKGEEYSRGEDDCNSNFKRVAQAIGSDPVTVAWIYALKHIDSISHYVKTRQTPSGESIEGRIGDAVNYLRILASLISETSPKVVLRETWFGGAK